MIIEENIEEPAKMTVSIVAAVGPKGEIGYMNKIPWRSKEDMKFFKSLTFGCPVIMGRKTFDSLNKPLSGRLNIVLTSDKHLIGLAGQTLEGPIYMHDLEPALNMLYENGIEDCFIIGGSTVYSKAIELDLVDRMFINRIKLDVPDADTYFPYIEETHWDIEKSDIKYNDFDAYLYVRKDE